MTLILSCSLASGPVDRVAGDKKNKYTNIPNDLLTGLLSPYQEIPKPDLFVRSELARAVRKSEGFIFLVRTE